MRGALLVSINAAARRRARSRTETAAETVRSIAGYTFSAEFVVLVSAEKLAFAACVLSKRALRPTRRLGRWVRIANRHFWATVCCLSCPVRPVCDVGVLWPNGWMD